MATDAESRTVPAKVYPAARDCAWVVEAPAAGLADGNCETFTGSRCLERALEFAYQAYGSVQVLSR